MKDGWSKQVRSGKHKPMECKKVAHKQKKSIEELLIKNIVHLVCFSITHSLQTMTECPLVDNQITRQKFTSNNNMLVLDVFPEMKKHISIQCYK